MDEKMQKVAESFGQYFIPRFVKECAARGIHFADEEELQAGLETAVMLKQANELAKQNGTVKSAKVQAKEMLKQAMAQAVGAQTQDMSEKQAAAHGIQTALRDAIMARQQEPVEA